MLTVKKIIGVVLEEVCLFLKVDAASVAMTFSLNFHDDLCLCLSHYLNASGMYFPFHNCLKIIRITMVVSLALQALVVSF